ncbi:predicted protein [Nematostella vectensis]|uniref:Uncharacterized protein n=1 Tax=Nematostella vectensis TaxID=45351 RepID=A7RTI5_NEMVE|nr:predicted protein [Nematostella vectensis]EDO45221.1 predicted protein [Nematostella vectensis]|eukprot:XP_001621243.1 hypothetical protein NEMVEDRAFT_v1g233833 [Nematostella vectensis]
MDVRDLAFVLACVLSGPEPYQSPEYNVFPTYTDEVTEFQGSSLTHEACAIKEKC